MLPEVRAEMEDWLHHARLDLQSARHLLDAVPPLTGASVFHSQQGAEKVLKAFLAGHDQPIAKTHELPRLIEQCEAFDPSIQHLSMSAQVLNPYATRFRYPARGIGLQPDESIAQDALRHATHIVEFVEQRLPG